MPSQVGENMNAPNLYGVLTIIAFILSMPFALYYEGAQFLPAFAEATKKVSPAWLIRQMVLDGFYYYSYNEVAFIALSKVTPIPHAPSDEVGRECIKARD